MNADQNNGIAQENVDYSSSKTLELVEFRKLMNLVSMLRSDTIILGIPMSGISPANWNC